MMKLHSQIKKMPQHIQPHKLLRRDLNGNESIAQNKKILNPMAKI